MMAGRPGGYRSLASLVTKLRALVESLPSEGDREWVRESIDTVVGFLIEFREAFAKLPTQEDAASVRESLGKLNEFVMRAQNDPVFSTVLGFRTKARGQGSQAIARTVDATHAKALLEKLESLPVDEIRRMLETDQYTMSELRGVAAQVGIRSTGRLSRESLVHQIAMKIANFRGYRQLGGDAKPE